MVRARAGERYDEGYERGLHDADAAAILDRLLSFRATAGLLRFAPTPRALACLFWADYDGHGQANGSTSSDDRLLWHRKAQSLGTAMVVHRG